MLWGSYITNLPKGNMGNFLLYPGTHHVIAHILRTKGQTYYLNNLSNKNESVLHLLKKEGIVDGEPYSLLVESGDILIAHPWLAH